MEQATQQIDEQQEPERKYISTPQPKPRKEKKAFAFGIWFSEWLTAGVVGLISGALTSAQKISDLFREDTRDASAFQHHFDGMPEDADINGTWGKQIAREFEVDRVYHNKSKGTSYTSEQWLEKHAEALEERLANPRDMRSIKDRLDHIDLESYLKKGKSVSEWSKDLRAEKKAIAHDFADMAYAWRGIRKNPILGTLDKMATLNERSMGLMAFNGIIGAAIGAAMTVSFFNGVATRDKIDKIAVKNGLDVGN